MTRRQWHCPKCGYTTPWHPSHTTAMHRCKPGIPKVVPMVLDDEGAT